MKNFHFLDAEIHQMPQGKIHIVHSDEKFSLGYLELNSQQKLDKICEPVDQEIIQLKGMSSVFVFHDGDEPEEVILHPGDYLILPAQTYYIQSNPSDVVSLSSWKLDGDATETIKEIREAFPKI